MTEHTDMNGPIWLIRISRGGLPTPPRTSRFSTGPPGSILCRSEGVCRTVKDIFSS